VKWIDGLCVFALSFGIVFCAVCVVNADVGFVSNPLWLSSSHVTEGVTVQASTVITKRDVEKVDGTVTFYSNGKEIGASDFSLPSSTYGVVVAVSWVPSQGTHLVSAKVTRAVAGEKDVNVAEEVKAKETLSVDPDNDRDRIADAKDDDDDNDGVTDADEKKKGTDPMTKDASAQAGASPAVAGASTSPSALVEQAKDIAGPVGETVFETTEGWREKGKEYFNGKVAGNTNTKGFASTTNKDLVSNPKEGVMGIWEMVQAYFYEAGAFVFGNVYAFYIFFILLILWILRKIWRKYSLD
jgi:hypothetical protein